MLNRTKVLAAGAAMVGTGVLLVGPLSAAAQEDDDPTETTTAAAPADEPPVAGDAAVNWLEEAIGTLVTSGTLTQEQADAVLAAIDEARPERGEGRGPGGRGHGGPMMGHWGDGLQAAATAIGIDETTLREAVSDGQTLAEVAEANSVDVQAVIDALVANANERIDEALADGRIDEAEATERKTEAVERITEMVNNGFPARGEGMGPGGPHGDDEAPADAPAPTDTTATDDTVPATTDGGS